MKIEIIAGSPRPESLTKRVALHLQHFLWREHQVDAGMINMQISSLPFIDKVWNQLHDVPPVYSQIARHVFDADAFILVTPEYNGSYSPALKNFLDHFPKQERKVFGIVSASPGGLGGIRAAIQLQNLIYGLSGIGAPRMLVVSEVEKKFDERGELSDAGFSIVVKAFTEEFLWLTQAVITSSVRRNELVA